MELLLTSEQTLLSENADRICAVAKLATPKHCDPDAIAASDGKALGVFADGGYLDLLVPDAHGGAGLGAVELSLLMRQAGRHLVTAPVAQALVTAWAVSKHANGALRERWLPVATTGQLILPAIDGAATAFATEGAQPVARRQAGRVVVSGSHAFIVSPFTGNAFLISARTGDEDIVLGLLEPNEPGASLRVQTTIDGSRALELRLDDVLVPETSILASGARATALRSTMRDLFIVSSSAELLGIAEQAQDIACAHIKLRKQFGRALGSYQVLQHRAVDCFVALELLSSLLWQVAKAIDERRCHPAMVAALNVKAVRTALLVTRASMQMLGAIGYTAEHLIGRLYRRALLLSVLFGGEAGQRAIFSRATGIDSDRVDKSEMSA